MIQGRDEEKKGEGMKRSEEKRREEKRREQKRKEKKRKEKKRWDEKRRDERYLELSKRGLHSIISIVIKVGSCQTWHLEMPSHIHAAIYPTPNSNDEKYNL